MKKLDDIPKNHPFKVPEGYFDELPGIIQSRVAQKTEIKEATPYFRYALQYALPVVLVVVVSWIYLLPKQDDFDTMLASVSTEEMVAYLEESEVTMEELMDEMDTESVDAIESEVYFNFDELDNLDELDLDVNNL